jgi:hypothetical protein
MRRRFWAWDGVYHGQTVFERVKILVTNSKREPLEPNEDSNYITMERTFFNILFSMGNICFAGSFIAFHPLPHRLYTITISLYPIGANIPRHTMLYLLLFP